MPTTALRITKNVSPATIGSLRRRAASAVAESGADPDLVASVRLCVSEALANAVVHAYPEHRGLVEIVVELDADRVLLTVRDEGRGLGPPVTPAREEAEGRLGLEIIRKLAQSATVTYDVGHGTEVRMAFAPAADSAGSSTGVED